MKLYKRILVVFLAVMMLCGTALSSSSYLADGNQGVANGNMTVREGIVENFKEFGIKILEGIVEDSIKDGIKGALGIPDLLPESVEIAWGALETAAYLYVDFFYEVPKAWSNTEKALVEEGRESFRHSCKAILTNMEDYYKLGVEHRGTNQKKPDFITLDRLSKNSLLGTIDRLEKIKKDNILFADYKARNKLQKLIDKTKDLLNKLPSYELYYNLGRYGSEFNSTVCNMKTGVKCRIISKSTGKYLNVYTDRAAEDLKNGDRIKVYKYAPDDTQEFCFVKNEQGAYRIRVFEGTKYLDVYNTVSDKIAKAGAKVQVWAKNNTHFRDQGFVFVYVNGYYRIHLAADTNYCLYVKSDGYVALGKVKENSSEQLWTLDFNV